MAKTTFVFYFLISEKAPTRHSATTELHSACQGQGVGSDTLQGQGRDLWQVGWLLFPQPMPPRLVQRPTG